MGQKPKIGSGEGATIRAMLATGESMAAAGVAVGVSTKAISLWCARERAAGRAVPIGKKPRPTRGKAGEGRQPRAGQQQSSPPPMPTLPPDTDQSTAAALRLLWGLAHDTSISDTARVSAIRAWREIQKEDERQPNAVDLADRLDSFFGALTDGPEQASA